MKIAEYNEMMAYLTRPEPEVLPQPKPQELLDLQEQNRKQRLLQSLQKIGPRLEDTSLDFINRENFGGGGVTKSLGNGLYEITYKGGSKVYFVEKYVPGTGEGKRGERIKKNFGKNKQAAFDYIKEFEKTKGPTVKEKAKETSKINLKKITDKVDKKYEKIKDKGYANIKEFRKSMVDLVDKKDFRDISRTQAAVKNYVQNKFKDIQDVVNINMEKALDKYYKVGGKKQGQFKEIAKEFGVNKDTLAGNTQKIGRVYIPVKTGEEADKKRESAEKRKKAEKKYSDPTFEYKMRGSKEVQLSHMDDLYSKIVKADTLGYSPELINNVILNDVDHYFRAIYKQRDKLLKNKPKGYKEAVEEINRKGIQLSQATDGYKSFEIEQPDGKKYQFGVDPGKTIDPTGIVEGKQLKGNVVETAPPERGGRKSKTMTPNLEDQFFFEENRKAVMQSQSKVTNKQMSKVAKQLQDLGFKCKLSDGTSCNNPMAYLDDIKKQQTLAKGSGNAAANAVKKLSAGKTIMREFLGPAALGFELAAAIPITYLGYKAGLPPARIVADATYGLFGDTEKARLKKEAVKAGIDTTEIQKSLDFEKASGAMQTLAQQEGEFRGPDDEMLFPQQYEKGEEDFYKAVGAFRDKAGNVSKDVYKKFGSQLQQLRDYIAKLDADRAAERSSKIPTFGIGDYIDFNSGGRVNYSNGSDGTALAIEESLEAFQRYLKAGGKLSYKDFIAVGGEGVSKFFNAGGRVGFADGPDNPKRRQFMKIMAGIASLPILGKFFKGAKSAKVVKLANTTTVMPDWFPAFVDKAFEKGIAKKIDADLTELEVPELPGVKVLAHDDGRIRVEGKNAYDETYEIEYTPPGYEVVDETTGKAVKTPGEFQASDTRFRQTGPELDDVDVDYDTVPDIEDIVGGNSTELEGFAKGTGETKYTKGQKAVDEADARSQYSQQERADFDQGPEIDPTDYTYED